ncbi:MAG: methyl-accepting chemotaxis protein [Spirochaetota bacterium]
MKWFNNLKVAWKVLVASLVFISLILVISFQGYNSLLSSTRDFDAFYANRFVAANQLNAIARRVLQIRVNMLQEQLAAEAGDWEEVDRRFQESAELTEQYQDIWEKYLSTRLTDREAELAETFGDQLKQDVDIRTRYKDALNDRDIEGSTRFIDQWLVEFEVLQENLVKLIDLQENVGQQLMDEQDMTFRATQILIVIVLALSILVGVVVTLILSRSISKPVNKGLTFAQLLADGNFTERIDLDQKDELGMLGNSLNSAADDLEMTISDIMIGTQNLVQAIQEISSGNENLSQRTSEQASSLEEIASTIEENTATINKNADNSIEANKLSTNAATLAEEGGKVMGDAVGSINEINRSSQKIEEIISVINDISFQTNLLALNAAVEAARAGEQGRGFAVVAGEVRNLAQRSGNAAKEISELIKDTINKVDQGTELSNKAGESLKEIIQAINEVSRFVSEIASASEEQKQGTEQINNAIAELDSMTQQNASLVEETASASEEMSNQAQELLARMEKFQIRDELYQNMYQQKHKEIHLGEGQKSTAQNRTAGLNTGGQKGQQKSARPHQKTQQQSAQRKDESIEQILTKEGFEEF